MSAYIEPIERLASMFRKLDGIGQKTALRLAMSTLDLSLDDTKNFSKCILATKTEIKLCKRCQNLSTTEYCDICSSETRDQSIICIVEDYKSVQAIERTNKYNGLYHVLHGTISPIKHISPDKLKIKELLVRLQTENVKEIIMATNPTVDGETTALYITKLLEPLGIKISRIANGVPVGGDIEYADEITLQRAFEGRHEIK